MNIEGLGGFNWPGQRFLAQPYCSGRKALFSSQRMLSSSLLCYYVVVSAAFGAGLDEVDAGKLVAPALSLPVELNGPVNSVTSEPCYDYACLHTSQEIMTGKLNDVLIMIVEGLPEFVENCDACERMLKVLKPLPIFTCQRAPIAKDYACIDEYIEVSRCVGGSHSGALERTGEILKLWSEGSFGSVDALINFLRVSIKALALDRKMATYYDGIFDSGIESLDRRQEDGSFELDQKAAEQDELTVFTDYEALTDGVVDQLEQMTKELESILKGLEGAQRVEAYDLFKRHLFRCFREATFNAPSELKERDGVFKISGQRMLSEVQALMWVRIFGELLEFKLKFLELDRGQDWRDRFLSVTDRHIGRFNAGPPLVTLEGVNQLGEQFWLVDSVKGLLSRHEKLRRWVYILYQKLRGDDQSVHQERAKEWLSVIEKNLCMTLETIELADRGVGLYTLGCLMGSLEYMTVKIESVLITLYEKMPLWRGEGEPGHFLVKLRQVISKMLREGSNVKNARKTRGPEDDQAGGDDSQQGESECLFGSALDGATGNGSNVKSGGI